MKNTEYDGHPDQCELLEYVRGSLPNSEERNINIHMANCDRCAKGVSALTHLRDNFDEIWDSWTAVNHGKAYRSAQIEDSVQKMCRKRTNVQGEDGIRKIIDAYRKDAELSSQVESAFLNCVAGLPVEQKERITEVFYKHYNI